MLPSRFTSAQSSSMRKSKLEGKPSLLPKLRRPGSTDRLSSEVRRPSVAGHRSSSAEPARATFGGGRLSREASATKIPLNRRSQQGDRFGQSSMTPLRTSQYVRHTTPVRTPSEDRASRSWQTSLERALAFVTVKDLRPISNVAWQRAECARVQEALAARGACAGAGGAAAGAGGAAGMALIRPLTIARFVEITGALLAALARDVKLNNDNYVAKLPHLSKRLLYPGTVSKSWLKTVNTLHAFPQALALIAYLLDLVNHLETPVSDESLYLAKDEQARLQRDYLYKCWIRFQVSQQYDDLNEEYLQNLKVFLGNNEEKIAELKHVIRNLELCLEDEAEVAARADEARRVERRDALAAALKHERAARRAARADIDGLAALTADHTAALRQVDVDIERANVENQQLKLDVENQPLTVEQRAKLLDEVDYAVRVQDSKRALAEQISKMVLSKETELALWQNKTLECCVEYKQQLIHLTARLPDLAVLAIDEKELMREECAAWVSNAVSELRSRAHALAERRAEHARERGALARQRAALLEETRTKIAELKLSVQREQQTLDSEVSNESAEAAAWATELRELNARMEELKGRQEEFARADTELEFWEKQDASWRAKLSELSALVASQREEAESTLEAARAKRSQLLLDNVRAWNEKLA